MSETGFSVSAQTARATAQAHREDVWDRLGILSWWAYWSYGPKAETRSPRVLTGSDEGVESTYADIVNDGPKRFMEPIDGRD